MPLCANCTTYQGQSTLHHAFPVFKIEQTVPGHRKECEKCNTTKNRSSFPKDSRKPGERLAVCTMCYGVIHGVIHANRGGQGGPK
jgi:hypothetical protein